ncbi:MAG: D-glycerate dehydrogenase [Phototrophicaceae bacterium]
MPKKPRVFVSRTIPEKPLAMLQAECDVHVWDEDMPPPRPKLLDELAMSDGVMSMLTEKIDEEALIAAPNLKVISNYAVGYDNIDVDAASKRKIPVGNTPGVLTETTADQAFALLLASARRLVEGVNYVRENQWKTWNPIQLLGRDVHGATLGIIGLGRIGYALAKRAQGFGMTILYHGGSNPDFAKKVGAKKVDLDTLLQESDYVSLHTPLTEKTYQLISERELSLMKETAILINTARGGIVDSDALVKALQAGTIAGAALDVTDPEPMQSEHPLVNLVNCIIVPHLGSATWQTRERMGILAAENLLAGLNDKRLPHCVNMKVYQDK